jgi:hypothetical protein
LRFGLRLRLSGATQRTDTCNCGTGCDQLSKARLLRLAWLLRLDIAVGRTCGNQMRHRLALTDWLWLRFEFGERRRAFANEVLRLDFLWRCLELRRGDFRCRFDRRRYFRDRRLGIWLWCEPV